MAMPKLPKHLRWDVHFPHGGDKVRVSLCYTRPTTYWDGVFRYGEIDASGIYDEDNLMLAIEDEADKVLFAHQCRTERQSWVKKRFQNG